MVGDEAGGLGAAVAVVDADEGGGGAGLDLAVVLEHLVGLHDGEGEVAGRVAPEVPRPEQQVVGVGAAAAAAVLIPPRTRRRVPPDPVPARGRNLLQPRPHPTFGSALCPREASYSPQATADANSRSCDSRCLLPHHKSQGQVTPSRVPTYREGWSSGILLAECLPLRVRSVVARGDHYIGFSRR